MEYEFKILSSDKLEDFHNQLQLLEYNIFNKNSTDIEHLKIFSQTMNIIYSCSFVFYFDNKPVGLFISSSRHTESYILTMFITKKHRGKGFGRILLEKGLSLLKQSHFVSTTLEVFQNNTSAINLYESEGFHITNQIFNFRNETRSFYDTFLHQDFSIKQESNFFLFKPIYVNFHKDKAIWQNSFFILYNKLKEGIAELYILRKNDTIIGFIVISRKENVLEIIDCGIIEEYINLFLIFISKILNNEKVVNCIGITKENYFYNLFLNNNFFIDSKQFEMRKYLK